MMFKVSRIVQLFINILIASKNFTFLSFALDSNVLKDELLSSLVIKANHYNEVYSNSKSISTEDYKFYNMDVGIDETTLWYVNVSIANQEQHLRLDVAQPYIWVPDVETGSDFNGLTFNLTEASPTPFSNYDIVNMTFIDTIEFNATAYISNLTLLNTGTKFLKSDNDSSWININTIGFFVAEPPYTLMGAFGIGGLINNTNSLTNKVASDYYNNSFLALDAMKTEGTISNTGYSLWLAGDIGQNFNLSENHISDENYKFSNFPVGSLMLNYVNSTLFTGELVKFESIPYYEVFTEGQSFSSNGYPIFPLSGANVIANTSEKVNLTTSDTITPIMLDSRFTVSYLPIDIIQQISIQTNAYYVETVESWFIDCQLGNINADLEFLFGQLSIKVPLKSFITKAYLSADTKTKTQLYFSSADGTKIPACNLNMKPSYLLGLNVLGAAFLQYAYLAADLESNAFALAQAANINGESLNIQTLITMKDTSTSSNVLEQTTHSSYSTSISKQASNDNEKKIVSTSTDVSTMNSTNTASFISSGFIPFAKSSNISATSLVLTSFSASSTQSKAYGSNVLEIYGYNFTYGSIFSNGQIITGKKSFYQTSLVSYETTTISGSTYQTEVSTNNRISPGGNTVYVVTTLYETHVTKINSNTTMYGSSPVTITSRYVLKSGEKTVKNIGNSGRYYNNRSEFFDRLLRLGLLGILSMLL
ncbi:hypothetical protein QEN19_000879 [Hanseniaspora menglaensis]